MSGIMKGPIKSLEHRLIPPRSREEAAAMLKSLRAAYQSLPPAKRSVIKEAIFRIAAAHSTAETDEENRCFALPC